MILFRGIGIFLALTFSFFGVFLLQNALARPMTAGSASVIGGSVFCALSLTLVYFLWKRAEK